MPTINKRFLFRLVLVFIALAGTLFGVHAVQADRIPAALLRQSERATEAGKGDIAIHYLRQYLEFAPEDVEAQIHLVELISERAPTARNQSELIFLYERILRLDPERNAIRKDALAACLVNSRYSDAATHAENLLKAFPTDAKVWQQLGAAQAGLNQLADARKSYETAITHAPDEILGYQRLAQLVWKNLSDPMGAREILNRMVKVVPQNPEAWLIRARFESFTAEDSRNTSAADRKQFMADLQRVLELDPENAEASLMLAETLQRDRKIPAASAVLRDVVSLYPRDLKLVRSLSWLELSRGNVPAAIAVLEDGLKASEAGFELLVPLADLLLQQGHIARTEEIIRRLEGPASPTGKAGTTEERRSRSLQVKYIKTRLAMRDSRWADAIAMLESLRADSTHLPALQTQINLLHAVCAGQTLDRNAEESAFRRVINADPKNIQARIGLSNLYLALGQFDEALREKEAAAQSPYASGALLADWIRLKIARMRVTGASQEEWRRLEQSAIECSARFGPASAEPIVLQAEIGLATGRVTEAVKLLRAETGRRPGDVRLWSVLAHATATLHGTAAGLAVLDEALAAAGDNPDVRLARARLYVAEPGRLRPIAPLAERMESWPEAEQIRLLIGMVDVFDHTDDKAAVTHTLKQLASRRPNDTQVWISLYDRALRTGDTRTTTEARNALVKVEGESGLSVLLCDVASATQAEAPGLINRLVATFGQNPIRSDVCLALGRLHALTGNEVESLQQTRRAFEIEPTRYEAAKALLLKLCVAESDQPCRLLVARLGTDPRWMGDPFFKLIGAVLERVQQPIAMKLLAWSQPHAEREPNGFAWLAEGAAANQIMDSLPLLEQASKRKNATVDDWLRLALARNANEFKAAKGKVPTAAYLAAAAVLKELPAGKEFSPELSSAEDRRLFAQAQLSLKLSQNQPESAANILEAYRGTKDLPEADQAWVQRNLAMLYAVGGTPEDRKRAMDLIAKLGESESSANELRSSAGVLTTLARYLEGSDRVAVFNRATAALAKAYEKGKSPKDLYRLSQLYRATGNRVESRKCLQVLLNSDPTNIYYLISAIDELIEDRNFEAANAFSEILMREYPGEFRAVATVARYQCRAGHPAAALALAEGFLRSADPAAGDHLSRSGRVAELLDELARAPEVRGTPAAKAMTDSAADRYAALVPNRAEAAVGLAGVLAADGRATEAFAKLEQLTRYLPIRVRAAAGLAIARASSVTEKQVELILEWLDICLKEEADSAILLMNRAELLAIRQDLTRAAAGYEKVLSANPRNVVALNNLAWLLAADPTTAERALETVNQATREVGLTGDLLDTRARVRITLKQFIEAERDLTEAIRIEPTGLRWFHLALSRMGQTPPRMEDATKAFKEAKRRGLQARGVHPTDRAAFEALELQTQGNK